MNGWMTSIGGLFQTLTHGLYCLVAWLQNRMLSLTIGKGFSLLEVLVVLAILMIFSQYAISYWQQQQYPIRREMAWLHLQHILLEQIQYYAIHQVYATNLTDISLQNAMNIGYDYSLLMTDDGFIASAQVQVIGVQAADTECWQLNLDHQGNKTAVDKLGMKALTCY